MAVNELVPIMSVSVILSVLAYFVTPKLARKLKKMNIVGVDVHKKKKPRIAEMGGIVIFLPLLFLFWCVYILTGSPLVLLVMASTIFFGVYGLIDDVFRLGKYQKLALSAVMGILLIIPSNPALMFVPIVLLLTIGIGNAFNLFAGFNGLEVGCSSLIALFFSLLCLLTGNIIPFYLSIGFSLILFSFLLHNKYPAKIFPGNIGTFTVGGFFVGISLYYNLYYLLIPLLSLHIGDMLLKGFSAGYFSSSEMKRTIVNGDNILVPKSDYLSMSRLVLKLRPMTERQLVSFFWAVMLIIGTSTVMITGVLL